MAKTKGGIKYVADDLVGVNPSKKNPSDSGCTYLDSDFKDFELVIGVGLDAPKDLLNEYGR